MELSHLRYFQVVARIEHITRSAEELHISQPALSKTISILEEELQVQLFDRYSKYIRLNEYGKKFLKKVDIALDALEDGKRELSDLAGNTIGTIDLVVNVASYLVPDLLAAFRQSYPQIHFHLLLHSANSAIRNNYDLCITASLLTHDSENSVHLLTEEIFLAVPLDHRLAQRSSIHLSEVAEEGFISLRSGKSLREMTDTFCRLAGFTPNINYESDDPSTLRRLIKAGQGVAFIPEITWGSSTGASVALLHIDEPVVFRRNIELSWITDRYMSEATILFRQFTIDYFARTFNNNAHPM
ncbi:MAG: LysR family transcriptional regulator [Paenibacillaceae bacterium]